MRSLNPWAANPAWQNFSSLYREAVTANGCQTGMERSHHLTATLYFGIAALEAFINERMRAHLKATKSEQEVFDFLRKEQIISKLKKWPVKLLGKPLILSDGSMELITVFNDIRGDLTHPKTHGQDIYARLQEIEPSSVVSVVAEYIVRYHEAEKSQYPYWLFGWNYLNPKEASYEIFIINEQQFSFSLQALGFQVPASAHVEAEAWRNHFLGTFKGYCAVHDALAKLDHCEPKNERFPHRPVLCKGWWLSTHHQTCGMVTQEAIRAAMKLDEA